MNPQNEKQNKGQFYTVQHSYILQSFPTPPSDTRCIIEPFAGKGDLLEWLQVQGTSLPIEAYDIDPKHDLIEQRDTLLHPPDYSNAWIITNPPYLARNKCSKKEYFDIYNTNDLYKCFLLSLTQQSSPCKGGIFILPVGFFLSPRDIDVRCRNAFLSKYKLTKVRYFEESVFPDTSTTIVAFSFEASPTPLTEQTVEWTLLPANKTQSFVLRADTSWIIGGDIYTLPIPSGIQVRRHVEGQTLKPNEQQTYLTLSALDSGKADGRICLEYKENYVYPAKESSRTYATLCIQGRTISAEQQLQLAQQFTAFLEKKRAETWSLFLPQYRESKEYARKRIPFELAYHIILHLLL
jgi:hypothetical protein